MIMTQSPGLFALCPALLCSHQKFSASSGPCALGFLLSPVFFALSPVPLCRRPARGASPEPGTLWAHVRVARDSLPGRSSRAGGRLSHTAAVPSNGMYRRDFISQTPTAFIFKAVLVDHCSILGMHDTHGHAPLQRGDVGCDHQELVGSSEHRSVGGASELSGSS